MIQEQYNGPIVFIIHAPLPSSETQEERELHLQKMRRAIRFANKHGLPVIFGKGGAKHHGRTADRDDFIFDFDLTTATSPENAAEFRALKQECKIRNVAVTLAEDYSGNRTEQQLLQEWKNIIKDGIKSARINPTKVIAAGWYREICVEKVEKILGRLYPKTELIEVRGDFTLSNLKIAQVKSAARKEHHKKVRAGFGIKRRTLSRRILRG